MMSWDTPVQPPIMIFGGAATLVQLAANMLSSVPFAAILVGAIAQVLAWCAFVFLQYTILVVQWTAQVPYASFEVPSLDWALVVIAYLFIFVSTRFSLKRLTGLFFSRPAWAAGLLAFISIFVWTSTLAAPDPRTHIQFIATSGGDAIFIRTANGARILIDGSAEPSALLGQLGAQLPFWDRRLDLVVATNLDEQNLAALNSVLERYTVGQVLAPPSSDDTGASYRKWSELLTQRTLPVTAALTGTHLQVDQVTLDVLYPAPDEASSNVALRVAAGNHAFLLAPALHTEDLRALTTGDTDLTSEFAALPVQVDEALLKRVAPRTVVLFVGKSSREQPTPDTLKVLNGVNVLRTDERGTIEFIFDGDEVQVQSER
jgi:competence protein ComEC